jgi:site-specific recombinase XerD
MSNIRDALMQYVALRRALGTKLQEPAMTLGRFLDFLEREKAEFITSELALRWAMQPQGVQRATWARRQRGERFAAWLSTIDARTEVPPRRLAARRRRSKPHIFTEQEIGQLMAKLANLLRQRECGRYLYNPHWASHRHRPPPGGSSGAGQIRRRSRERDSRGSTEQIGKSRFVPVTESTRAALADYAKQRDKLCSRRRSEAFLVSERGDRLQSCTARRTSATMSCTVGLRPATGSRRIGRGPRLQDFRHCFATRKLIEWYRAGLEVGRELPKLATYLGHVDVAHTYWYLEAVPELLELATERLAGASAGGKR